MEITFTVKYTAEALRDCAALLERMANSAPVRPGSLPMIPLHMNEPEPDMAPAIEVPPVPAPTPEPEVDSEGVAWQEGVHADNKAKCKDGTWRKRRNSGTKAPPPKQEAPEVDPAKLQEAVGKLFAAGVDVDEFEKATSQAVFRSLEKTKGGVAHVNSTGDRQAAFRAMNACHALAVSLGIEL